MPPLPWNIHIQRGLAVKIFLNGRSVYDEAVDRLRRLFREFDGRVIACSSGGKDSTVVTSLALMVAEELDMLPLKVMYFDEEVVFNAAAEYMGRVLADPRVEPLWVQTPIHVANALSQEERWFKVWDPKDESKFMRPHADGAITENPFGGIDLWFTESIFEPFCKHIFGDQKACMLGGVRTEESPSRYTGLTTHATFEEITWGKVLDKACTQMTFYPIYDWTVSDVWKYIHDNEVPYCRIYDWKYQYGVHPKDMRVSSLIHTTAMRSLWMLQEVEPETWHKLVKRVPGVAQAAHISQEDAISVRELPHMFSDWKDYRDYLVEELIADEAQTEKFTREFAKLDRQYELLNPEAKAGLWRKQANCVLVQDSSFYKLTSHLMTPIMHNFRQWRDGKCNPTLQPKTRELWSACPVAVQVEARKAREAQEKTDVQPSR